MLPKRSKKKFKFSKREIRYFLGKQVAFRILQCVYDSTSRFSFFLALVTWFSVIDQACMGNKNLQF